MKSYFLIACLLFLYACETVVDLSADEEQIPVLNSLLCPDSSRIRVDLNYSAKVVSRPQFPVESGAQIELHENGQAISQATFDSDNHCYFIPYRVKTAHTYRIIASLPSGQVVRGETQVPEAPGEAYVQIDTTVRHNLYITSRWQNHSGQNRYYWIYGYGKYSTTSNTIPFYMGCTDPVVDPFNVEMDSDFNPSVRYEGHMRVESKNGNPEDFSVTYQVSRDGQAWSHLICVDRHYDLYLKAYVKNKLLHVDLDDLPLFFTPFYMYSNVEGGTGIVGSYAGICASL